MTKQQKKTLLALLVVFATLTLAFLFVVRPLVNRLSPDKPLEPIELLEGEAYYYNQGYHETLAVLFPQFSRADLYSVRVWNKENNYEFQHVISDAAADADNYFLLGSDSDGDGKSELYMPELDSVYPGFEYSTLYDDTSKIPTVISVTGSCFFKDRIYVRANDASAPGDAAYQEILSRYGLADADQPSYYEVKGYAIDKNHRLVYSYTDGNGAQRLVFQSVKGNGKTAYYTLNTLSVEAPEAWSDELGDYDFETYGTLYTGSLRELKPMLDPARSYKVYVGDRTPDRTGYYLRVDGRDVVYTTGTSSVGEVVNKSLAYYVSPRIMAASSESYAPYMALGFGLWQKSGVLSEVIEGSGVLYKTDSIVLSGEWIGSESGLLHLLKGKISDRLFAALLGKAVGNKLDAVIPEKLQLLPSTEDALIEYVFYSIDGIVGVDKVNRTAGTAVREDDMILVTYRIETEGLASELYRGAVDLSDPLLAGSVKAALVGKAVGGDASGVTELVRAEVALGEGYADTFTETYRIAEIVGFASNESLSDINTTKNAALPSKGYAQIYCTVVVNGVLDGRYLVINLEKETTHAREQIRQKLIGRANGVPEQALTVDIVRPYSAVMGYVLYEDLEILAIGKYDEQLSFKFVNELDRDKFHGSNGIYEITGPIDRTMYALDSSTTQNLLANFADLVGTETVAVGITAETIRKYGLDAHVFYFEYPFGIGEADDGNDKVITYSYQYSVPYCIYVSERQADGSYYVASTLYGTVVRATGEVFGFVDYEFTEDWMLSSILQLSVYDIAELSFNIQFSDLKETHSFALSTNPLYYVYAGINANGDRSWAEQKRLYASYVAGEIKYTTENVNASKVLTDNREYSELLTNGKSVYYTWAGIPLVDNREYAESMRKDLTHYYTKAGVLVTKNGAHYQVRRVVGGTDLDLIYLNALGTATLHGNDYDGVYNLTNLVLKIFLTSYSGASSEDLDEAAKTALLADPDSSVFEIALKLTDGRSYKLSFHRYSDSRCLVRFSDESKGIVNTELYLNTYEVKGLVSAVRALANGQPIDVDTAYTPDLE